GASSRSGAKAATSGLAWGRWPRGRAGAEGAAKDGPPKLPKAGCCGGGGAPHVCPPCGGIGGRGRAPATGRMRVLPASEDRPKGSSLSVISSPADRVAVDLRLAFKLAGDADHEARGVQKLRPVFGLLVQFKAEPFAVIGNL